MPRRSHTLLRAVLLLCTLGLIVPAAASPGTAVPAPSAATVAAKPDPKPNPHRAQRAVEALERVQDLLAGTATTESLTLELKDLALLRDALPPAAQRQADVLLARPTDSPKRCQDVPGSCFSGKSKRICSAVICVHWVPKRVDSRNGVKGGARPAYVRKTLKAMTHVHQKYVAAGYRKPYSDRGRGGNNKPDVYLSQIGNVGYYGYCTTDDPTPPRHGGTWGYCVLDNDYRKSEFPAHTPIENMKVTAAHEYFHNVQFAHDIGEDNWFMEATATWAEDEVYDHINDNAFYLPHGPISNPLTPLDSFDGLFHYGTWVFMRYLTDRYGTKVAGMDDLVLNMWKDATGRERAKYSLAAVVANLEEAGTSLPVEFAKFAAGNRQPALTYPEEYAEVAADPENETGYPRAPLADGFTLTPGATQGYGRAYNHLTSRTIRYEPSGTNVLSNLTLNFDLLDGAGAAVIVVKPLTGDQTQTVVTADGNAAPIPFDAATVDWVEVTLANGSSRFDCWQRTQFSCAGSSLDDGAIQKVTATVTP